MNNFSAEKSNISPNTVHQVSHEVKFTPTNLKTRFEGKVAVCTAATEGIGFAIAKRLAQEGAKVVISSRRREKVDLAVDLLRKEGLSAIGTVCHVSNAEDRRKLFETAYNTFGGIDILISNAGANPNKGGYVLDCSEEEWDKIFDVNVKSSFLLSKEILPYFEKRGGGKILYTSSIAGVVPQDVLGAYSVSKTAILGLTKTAAQSLAQKNITVNCIAPGMIKTNFSKMLMLSDSIRNKILEYSAMKRFGTVEEVSGVAAFLVSEDASYITGEIIIISGGLPSRL